MSHELLYTSAPKGLKSGSRGFCTVVCTQGIPAPLVTALESLSAYRHIYPPGDRNAAKNPVAWSHLKMNVAGRACHVVSRIADFGLDYSQRGNKLAHHVALEMPEQTAGGPAWLLEQSGNMQTDWDGQPRLLPAGRRLRTGSRPPAICTAWQAMTGDAGWAGVLAESFLQNPDRPVYIVFAPGMDLLPLIAESIGLLPAERRWDVTFNTYFTSLPPGVSCAWRCVLSGSPEAEESRKFGKALHINLCGSVPPATGGDLVLAARTGRAIERAARPPQFATADADWTDDELAAELELSPVENGGPMNPGAGTGVRFSEHVASPALGNVYVVGQSPPAPQPPPPPIPGRKKRRTLAELNAEETARRPKRIRWVIASLFFVLVGLIVAVFAIPKSREWALRQTDRLKHLGSNPDKTQDPLVTEQGDKSEAGTKEPQLGTRGSPKATPDEMENVSNPADSDDREKGLPSHPSDEPAKEKPIVHDHAIDPNSRVARKDSENSASKRSPTQFAGKELPIVRMTEEYHLFAINIRDAVEKKQELRVRIHDAKSNKVSLRVLAPGDHTNIIKSSPKDGDGPEVNISTSIERATGLEWLRVLTISKSIEGDDCVVRFSDPISGWEVLEWCLLSIEEANRGLCLFSLQQPDLKWERPRFDNSSFTLPFKEQGDWMSPETIRIDSVNTRFSDVTTSVRFCDPNQNGSDLELSGRLAEECAKKIFVLQPLPELKLSATHKNRQIQLISPHVQFNKLFDNELDARLKKIETMHNRLPLLIQNAVTFPRDNLRKAIKTDNTASKSPLTIFKNALNENILQLKLQVDNANDKVDPSLQQQIAQARQILEQIRSDLKSLEDSRVEYLKLKEALQNAEISDLLLHYDFHVPVRVAQTDRFVPRSVRVELTFQNPTR